MNKFQFMGKVTNPKDGDPLRIGNDKKGNLYCAFTLAVYDSFRKESDFFNVIAFGKQAEICEKFLNAGSWVGITGRMKNRHRKDEKSGYSYTEQAFVVENITLPPRGTDLNGDNQRTGATPPPQQYGGL